MDKKCFPFSSTAPGDNGCCCVLCQDCCGSTAYALHCTVRHLQPSRSPVRKPSNWTWALCHEKLLIDRHRVIVSPENSIMTVTLLLCKAFYSLLKPSITFHTKSRPCITCLGPRPRGIRSTNAQPRGYFWSILLYESQISLCSSLLKSSEEEKRLSSM